LKHHEALHPGLLERGARSVWHGYRWWRARREAEQDGTHFQVETESLDGIERVKLWFARTAMFLGAFLLMVVAAWSVGFFFAGMHDFTLNDQDTALIYGGAFALEAIFTGAMFTVALQKKRGRPWGLLFAGALVLALVSMLAQFASYEAQLQQGRLQVSDSAIEAIPFLTWLVGSMHGHSFLFLLRGGAFHFAEILACLGMPSKKRSLSEQISTMEQVQRARLQFEEAQLLAELRTAVAQRVQQDLRARVGLAVPNPALALSSGEQEVEPLVPFRLEADTSPGNGHQVPVPKRREERGASHSARSGHAH
jgi:hypothetical protein